MRKNNNVKIGKNIQKIRKSFGYTQEKLAEEIDCSTRYISDIEQCKSSPSYEVLINICNLFKIGMDDIFGEYLDEKDELINFDLSGFSKLTSKDKEVIIQLISYLNKN